MATKERERERIELRETEWVWKNKGFVKRPWESVIGCQRGMNFFFLYFIYLFWIKKKTTLDRLLLFWPLQLRNLILGIFVSLHFSYCTSSFISLIIFFWWTISLIIIWLIVKFLVLLSNKRFRTWNYILILLSK